MTSDQILQQAVDALRAHNWPLLIALGVMLFVAAARVLGSRLPGKLGKFVASTRGGLAINVVSSIGGAVVTSELAHRPIMDIGFWLTAGNNAATAAGGWALLKAAFFPSDAPSVPALIKGRLARGKSTATAALALAMLSAFMALPGCGATGAEIRADLPTQCGAQYAALEPIVLNGLASAATAGEAAGAILLAAAAASIPADVSAVVCTIKVVVADLEKKAAAAPKGVLDPTLQHQLDIGHKLLAAYDKPHAQRSKPTRTMPDSQLYLLAQAHH